MLPHMVGEFVVLLFLKLPVVERFRCFRQFTGKRFEQKVDKLGLSRMRECKSPCTYGPRYTRHIARFPTGSAEKRTLPPPVRYYHVNLVAF